jgi:hypothetical protein
MLVVGLYMSSSAVFEKLLAILRVPTKFRGFYRGTLLLARALVRNREASSLYSELLFALLFYPIFVLSVYS